MEIGADGMDGLGVQKRVAVADGLGTELAMIPPLLLADHTVMVSLGMTLVVLLIFVQVL